VGISKHGRKYWEHWKYSLGLQIVIGSAPNRLSLVHPMLMASNTIPSQIIGYTKTFVSHAFKHLGIYWTIL
jgi:hypothetical protein